MFYGTQRSLKCTIVIPVKWNKEFNVKKLIRRPLKDSNIVFRMKLYLNFNFYSMAHSWFRWVVVSQNFMKQHYVNQRMKNYELEFHPFYSLNHEDQTMLLETSYNHFPWPSLRRELLAVGKLGNFVIDRSAVHIFLSLANNSLFFLSLEPFIKGRLNLLPCNFFCCKNLLKKIIFFNGKEVWPSKGQSQP